MNRWFETGASSGGNTRAKASFEVVFYVDDTVHPVHNLAAVCTPVYIIPGL